jgi:hypothetical protein
MLDFIVLVLKFMRMHSLQIEKHKKIVLNSKWCLSQRCLPKIVFDRWFTKLLFFKTPTIIFAKNQTKKKDYARKIQHVLYFLP